MWRCSNELEETENKETYYLPHHAVITEGKVTNELRVGFKASSREDAASNSLHGRHQKGIPTDIIGHNRQRCSTIHMAYRPTWCEEHKVMYNENNAYASQNLIKPLCTYSQSGIIWRNTRWLKHILWTFWKTLFMWMTWSKPIQVMLMRPMQGKQVQRRFCQMPAWTCACGPQTPES